LSVLKLINTINLSNGLKVSIYDLTKVYFGDYHHVKVKVICSLDNSSSAWQKFCPANVDLQAISYTRTIDKMGVPAKEIDSVIRNLLSDFDLNSIPYISSPDFLRKLINNELSCKKPSTRKYLGSGS